MTAFLCCLDDTLLQSPDLLFILRSVDLSPLSFWAGVGAAEALPEAGQVVSDLTHVVVSQLFGKIVSHPSPSASPINPIDD